MSRARLGLYVFARVSLFKNCFELTPAFAQLMQRPLKLQLIPQEHYPTDRLNDDIPSTPPMEIEDMPHMAKFVYDYYIEKISGMKESQKAWQKPGMVQTPGSPTYKVPAHPGADDDTDDEELNQMEDEKENVKEETVEPKFEVIENLVEEATSENEDNDR